MSLSFKQLVAQFQTVDLHTLLWLPGAKANAAGECPIHLRITIDGRRIERSTGIRVKPEEWDAEAHRIKGKHALAAKQNEQLRLLQAHIPELVNLMKATGKKVTAQTLAAHLDRPEEVAGPCLLHLFKQQIELHYTNGNQHSRHIYNYGLSVLSLWQQGVKQARNSPLPLEEFTPDAVGRFYTWMLTRKQLSVKSANAVIANLNTLYRKAVQAGIVEAEENPFRLLRKRKVKRPERIRLTLAQLNALRDAELPPLHAEARDVYMAQYYLHGSRVGAVLTLTWADVGPDAVRLQAEKGGPLKYIPITPHLAAILARYRPARVAPGRPVFPFLPATYFNLDEVAQYAQRKRAVAAVGGRLRKVALLLDLPGTLHPHTARHTLALHAASVAGLQVAQQMLGHASIRETEGYVGALPSEALRAAERLLYGGAPPSEHGDGRVVPMWNTLHAETQVA